MSLEDNKALVVRFIGALASGDDGGVREVADQYDFVDHNPLPGIAGDREGYKEFVQFRHQAFADQLYTVQDQIAVADRVVERWSIAMTHAGGFLASDEEGWMTKRVCRAPT